MDFNLKLEQTQKLIITPEIKLAITLLQYSTLDLQDHIHEELLNNPVLEIEETVEEDLGDEKETVTEEVPVNEDEFSWDRYFQETDSGTFVGNLSNNTKSKDNQPLVENYAEENYTMLEDLLSQLRMLQLSPGQYSCAAYLVGNLDEKGYLQGDIGELAASLGSTIGDLKEALEIIQGLEPVGIGCRNLRECLLLQINKHKNAPILAGQIVKMFLPAAADGRYRYIASRLRCEEHLIYEAVNFIRTLNPKPGSVFKDVAETRYIIPDIIVENVDGHYLVTANDTIIPQLLISPYYKDILKENKADDDLAAFVKEKIERAAWLIRSIEQRRVTLFLVAQQIVNIQKTFLDKGIKHLKPLTLREVGIKAGVHESTVSRATANKYIQTPRGLYPMKFFLSSGLTGSRGNDYSSPSIKTYIREIVDTEDAGKPFSDQSLASILQKRGISISRRTVTKYREELNIPTSYKRRCLYDQVVK